MKYSLLLLSLALLCLTGCSAVGDLADSSKHFHSAGHLVVGRAHHSATLLKDGQILILGGGIERPKGTSSRVPPDSHALSAEIYNPRTKQSALVPPAGLSRIGENFTFLQADGKVLILNAVFEDCNEQDKEIRKCTHAGIFDPKSRLFNSLANFIPKGTSYTATQLSDGRVVIVGGVLPLEYRTPANQKAPGVKEIYIFNPAHNQFAVAGKIKEVRYDHSAILTPSNQILIVGGYGWHRTSPLKSIELYNPTTGQSEIIGYTKESRRLPTLSFLNNQEVLISGGNSRSLELFNLHTRQSEVVAEASSKKFGQAFVLPSRKVLLLEGKNVELFDPGTHEVRVLDQMIIPRDFPEVIATQNKKLYAIGGRPLKGGRYTDLIEELRYEELK